MVAFAMYCADHNLHSGAAHNAHRAPQVAAASDSAMGCRQHVTQAGSSSAASVVLYMHDTAGSACRADAVLLSLDSNSLCLCQLAAVICFDICHAFSIQEPLKQWTGLDCMYISAFVAFPLGGCFHDHQHCRCCSRQCNHTWMAWHGGATGWHQATSARPLCTFAAGVVQLRSAVWWC